MPPSASVHCIDPWEGNEGVRSLEAKHGVSYGLEQFMAYTRDCPNVIARRGYSPRDFKTWTEKIDLFYEDSVHRNPVLKQNLEFWSAHLKPEGVACGDDYRPRFQDVVNEVHSLAERLGRELIVIDKFWCLLPPASLVPEADGVRSRLLAIREEAEASALAAPDSHAFTARLEETEIDAGQELGIDIHACNDSPRIWTGPDGREMSAHVSVQCRPEDGSASTAKLLNLSVPLRPDCPVRTTVRMSTCGLSAGRHQVSARLILIDAEGAVRKLLTESRPSPIVIRTVGRQSAEESKSAGDGGVTA